MVSYNPFSPTFYKRKKTVKKYKEHKQEKGAGKMSKQLKELRGMAEKMQSIGVELLENYQGKENTLQSHSKEIRNELKEILDGNHESRKSMILKRDEISVEESKMKERQNEIAVQLIIAEIEEDEELAAESEEELSELNRKIESLKAKREAYNRLSKLPMRIKERKKIAKLYKNYKRNVVDTTLNEEYQEIVKEFNNVIKKLQKAAEHLSEEVGSSDKNDRIRERNIRFFTNEIGITRNDIIKVLKKHGVSTHNYEFGRPDEKLSQYVEMWLNSEKEEGFSEFIDNYVRTAIKQGKLEEVEFSQLESI